MQRIAKYSLLAVVLAVIALAIDYGIVKRKEKLLSNAVSQISGHYGSIPVWPLGTEYRITLTAIPTPEQLEQLKVANQMRGWVGIAFEGCELTAEDADRLQGNLERCHLFVVQDARLHPIQPSSHGADASGGF